MRHRIGTDAVVVSALMLTACTPTGGPEGVQTTAADAGSIADADRALDNAQQRVDRWLGSTPTPEGTVSHETLTTDVFDQSHQGWVCTPMATGTAYWSVPSTTVIETVTWMIANPVPGLEPTLTSVDLFDPTMQNFSFGNIEERGVVEGIAFTLVQTGDDVAIRAEAGVIPEGAACQTLGPGEQWGSPGEG
ncbi:hypothetical protein ACWGJP_11270 [Microbacterium sp. NPDC055903]